MKYTWMLPLFLLWTINLFAQFPISTIDENNSTACSGILLDSGGENEDYTENENHTFTICPNEPSSCILFDIEFYNLELDFDYIRFYEGGSTSGELLTELTGGGVDYQIQANSNCLTIQFISDGLNNFEGFKGTWSCSMVSCAPSESITISSNPSEQDIIDNLATPQVSISNIVLNCQDGAAGTFQTSELVDLNMEKGIILTTGLAANSQGPNEDEDIGFEHPPFAFDMPSDPGDPDLNILSPTDSSLDACVLEFDVFVATNELRFDYIFGSEEYPEFAPPNVSFNDIFAFLISGPGIEGFPALNNQKNIAVLPDGTPVSVNSINPISHWNYYKDNRNNSSIEYDGLIIDKFGENGKLVARSKVEPCNTYHLKLAIADRGDEGYDSGVFVSELKSGAPKLSLNFDMGMDFLMENCSGTSNELLITLDAPQEDTATFLVTIEGTATQDTDYVLDIPMLVTFLPGDTSMSFPISVLSDMEVEPTETVEISISNDFGCGMVDLVSISFEIRDQVNVEILDGRDTLFACQGDHITVEASGAETYVWTADSIVNGQTNSIVTVMATSSQYIFVEGTDVSSCSNRDSIYIQVQSFVELITTADVTLCSGETLPLQVRNDLATNFEWSPENQGLSCTNCENPILTAPSATQTYSVTADVMGCTMQDDITVTIPSLSYQFPINPVICLGNGITLNLNPNPINNSYIWTSPDDPSFSSTEAAPKVSPMTTTNYHVVVSTDCAMIEDEVTVVVVGDAMMTVSNDTTICEGSPLTLSAQGTAPGTYTWTWDNNTENGNEITVHQDLETVEYTVSYTYGNGCGTLTESVMVSVNPYITLDDSALDLADELSICAGEAFSIDAAGQAEGSYLWTWTIPSSSGDTTLTADGNSISPIQADTSTIVYYVSFTDEAACLISNDSTQVTSNQIPDIELTADTLMVVEGSPVTLFAHSSLENLTYEWSEGNSTDNSIIVYPLNNPSTYEVTVTTEDACSNTAMIIIETEAPMHSIPNVFTPNGDNTNDFFNIVSNAPFEIIEFRVYNRWGQIVYDNERPETGWDGEHQDKLAPSDVYVYYVLYSINGIEQAPFKGDVTLVR